MSDKVGFSGLMGWPVKHSLSPKLHKYWLNQYNIESRYDLLPIEPENLENALSGLFLNGFAGCNLTSPHKEDAIFYMNDLTTTARAIKAINTVIVAKNGKLLGDNTDVYGFTKSLDEQCPDWKEVTKHAVVIGAGGAAKAVIYALKRASLSKVTVVNRTIDKAQGLAPDFAALKDVNTVIKGADMVINTTSLGMAGNDSLDVNLGGLSKTGIVVDIVYRPRMTPLLLQAQNLGLRTAEGIDMLIHQAAPCFEHWFGILPKVTPDLKDMMLSEVKK